MKRDMDLVRKILFAMEELPPFATQPIEIEGYDKQQVAYHCEMLCQKGYIKHYHGETCDNFDGVIAFWVQDLTWEGQDFLETIRQDTIWNNTKKAIKDKGLPMLTSTIGTIATAFITATAEGVANSIIEHIKNGGI